MNHLMKGVRFNVEHGDLWLAWAGLGMGVGLALVLIAIGLHQPLGLAVTIQATALSYLLLRSKLLDAPPIPDSVLAQRPTPLAGFLVSVVAAAALAAISASAGSMHRPLWVFVLLAVLPAFILAQGLALPKTQDVHTSLILQMLVLTTAIVLTSITAFPHNGGDTWAHLHNAERILEQRTVQAIAGAYRDYPLYPATLAVLSTLTGLEIAQAARFLSVFIAVVSLLLMLGLSQRLHSHQESLALALLLLGSKWFIHWTTLVVSMSMALLFFCLLAVLLLRRLYRPAHARETLALLIVAGVAPFFHPVGAVATIFLLLGISGLESLKLDGPLSRRPPGRRSLLALAGLVVIFTLTQWMYYGNFIFDRTIQGLTKAIFSGDSSLRLASSHRDVTVYTLDQLNFYVLLGLAGLDVIRQLWFRRDRLNLYAGVLGLAFVGFGYATQAVGLLNVLPYRWFLFGTLLLVFPASSTFVRLFHRRAPWVRGAACLLLAAYFFIGLTNTEANRDHPLYGEDVTQLFELTASEYAGLLRLEEVMQRRDVDVRVDFRLWDYLKYQPGNERAGYWHQIELEACDGVFPIRAAYWHRDFLVGGSVPDIDFRRPRVSLFYDSGDMQLLDCRSQE